LFSEVVIDWNQRKVGDFFGVNCLDLSGSEDVLSVYIWFCYWQICAFEIAARVCVLELKIKIITLFGS